MKSLKIFPTPKKIDILIIADLVLICLSLWFLQTTNIDLEIQKYFFNFENKNWLIDRSEPIKKFVFYIFPKIVFGLIVTGFLLAAIIGFKNKSREKFYKNRHRFLLIFLGLALIPLVGGNIKKFTNIYCPNQLEIYDGNRPYVKIFSNYPKNFIQEKNGQCFPAGHCVTGFALMILFFALSKKSQRILGLTSGIILGWITGLYQMAKGAHFFGDTLVSMLVCFLIAALLARIYFKMQKND